MQQDALYPLDSLNSIQKWARVQCHYASGDADIK